MMRAVSLGLILLGLSHCGPDDHRNKPAKSSVTTVEYDCSKWDSVRGDAEFQKLYRMDSLVTWHQGPVVGVSKSNEVSFTFVRHDAKPVQMEAVCFFPFMKVHGHGAVGEPQVVSRDVNSVRFNGFAFQMSGPWELEVRVQIAGERYGLSLSFEIKK